MFGKLGNTVKNNAVKFCSNIFLNMLWFSFVLRNFHRTCHIFPGSQRMVRIQNGASGLTVTSRAEEA